MEMPSALVCLHGRYRLTTDDNRFPLCQIACLICGAVIHVRFELLAAAAKRADLDPGWMSTWFCEQVLNQTNALNLPPISLQPKGAVDEHSQPEPTVPDTQREPL